MPEPHTLYQRLKPWYEHDSGVDEVGLPTVPIFGVRTSSLPVQEGTAASCTISRSNILNPACRVRLDVTCDDPTSITGVLAKTIFFDPKQEQATFTVPTVARNGSQGNRTISFTLSTAVNGYIDPRFAIANASLVDSVLPVNPWWARLPETLPSRRPFASGPSYYEDDYPIYEALVALSDGLGGGNFGGGDSRIQTLDLMAGGDPAFPDIIDPNSQLQWQGVRSSFASPFEGHPPNTAWCVFVFDSIPREFPTNGPDHGVPIWEGIITGNWDNWYLALGHRIRLNFERRGIDLKWFIGRMNHEMQQTNHYRIFADTKLLYKAAAERIYSKIREGAAYPTLRFVHAPSKDRVYSSKGFPDQNFGDLASWTPSNVDGISMSYHPGLYQNSVEKLNQFNYGNRRVYGLFGEVLNLCKARQYGCGLFEWSPNTNNKIADLVYAKLYDEFLLPNKEWMICDLVFNQSSLNPAAADAVTGQTDEGKAAWRRGVEVLKTKWSGVKS